MTQLVAAICDDGRRIVTASDRMIGSGDMTLQFEQPRTKAEMITDSALVLLAGTAHEPDVVRDLRAAAKGKEALREIADVSTGIYQGMRMQYVCERVLKRSGFSSLEEFHLKQQTLVEGLVAQLQTQIDQYELGLELLLVGVDEEAHIIRITDPGTWVSFDQIGFCCVGMGDRHADNVFAWYQYSRNFTLNEALCIAFEAKKRSEAAGGVGSTTDMMVIDTEERIREVDSDTISKLERAYDASAAANPREELSRRLEAFNATFNGLAPGTS